MVSNCFEQAASSALVSEYSQPERETVKVSGIESLLRVGLKESPLMEAGIRSAHLSEGALSKSVMKAFTPDTEGKAFRYSLKLPESAGKLDKVMQYGLMPAFLGANAYTANKSIHEANDLQPADLVEAGLSPAEAVIAKKQIVGAAYGRAAGDLAGWALYPASFRNPLLHNAVALGGNIALPSIGERLGKAIS